MRVSMNSTTSKAIICGRPGSRCSICRMEITVGSRMWRTGEYGWMHADELGVDCRSGSREENGSSRRDAGKGGARSQEEVSSSALGFFGDLPLRVTGEDEHGAEGT